MCSSKEGLFCQGFTICVSSTSVLCVCFDFSRRCGLGAVGRKQSFGKRVERKKT